MTFAATKMVGMHRRSPSIHLQQQVDWLHSDVYTSEADELHLVMLTLWLLQLIPFS